MGKIKVGFGFDVHQLKENHPFVLGGVKLEHHAGAYGHSDADVLLHAICDALLGAANLRDIGRHYPDTSAEFRGIDSRKLLRDVAQKLAALNLRVVNIDATIIAQEPRMAPHV